MTSIDSIPKLNDQNYSEWSCKMKDHLRLRSLWSIVIDHEKEPAAPDQPGKVIERCGFVAKDHLGNVTTVNLNYLGRLDRYNAARTSYFNRSFEAAGTIAVTLSDSIRIRYVDDKYDNPTTLWNGIKTDFENVIKLGDKHQLMKRLVACKLEDFPSVSAWVTTLERIINDLKVCGTEVDDNFRYLNLRSNLPDAPAEWAKFKKSIQLTDNKDRAAYFVAQLHAFEAEYRSAHGVAPGDPLFVKNADSSAFGSKPSSVGVMTPEDPPEQWPRNQRKV